MKRAFDIAFALLLFLVLLPLLLILACSIAFTSSGGAFFRQVRVGRGGQDFRLVKFRTMRTGSEAKGRGL